MTWTDNSPNLIENDPVFTELHSRIAARERIIDFAKYVDPAYIVDPLHEAIGAALDRVISGEYQRLGLRGLIINVPPQHGKSDLVSVKFPAYSFGKNPEQPIILTSYASELAEDKSFQVRGILRSDAYQRLFPETRLHPDSQAKNMWKLDAPYQKTHLLTGGVNSGVTGFGGMVGIIDDPYKNWEEAQSPTTRTKVDNFYRTVLRTRLWQNSFVIVLSTRWHPDDLPGVLARTGKWAVLRVAALAETQDERDANNVLYGLPMGLPDPLGRQPGEACSPSRFPVPMLLENKEELGSLMFRAIYQQDPRGITELKPLTSDNFERRDSVPDDVIARSVKYRYWDKAGTEGGGKFTASVMLMYDQLSDMVWIPSTEIEHFQYGARKREIAIQAVSDRDDARYGYGEVHTWIEQEPGSGGKESAENTLTGLTGVNAQLDKVNTDKDVRIQPFLAKCQAGKVCITRGSGGDKLITELLALPNAVYRDLSDCAGGAFAKLVQSIKNRPSWELIQAEQRAHSSSYLNRLDQRRRTRNVNNRR
jgi:phage terminase large subunit-like protein